MKRSIAILAIAASVLVSLALAGPASAGRRPHSQTVRVVRQPYSTSLVVLFPPFGGLGDSCSGNCLRATAEPGEHNLRINMYDSSGLPVYGYLTLGHASYPFCGSTVVHSLTSDAISVEAAVHIDPLLPCGEPTVGTIVATFSG